MEKEEMKGCLIDGSLGRSPFNRYVILSGFLLEIDSKRFVADFVTLKSKDEFQDDEEIEETEMQLINAINERLDGYGLTIFLEAGDVIICDISEIE